MCDRRRRHDLHAARRRNRARRGVGNGADGWICGERMDVSSRREEHRRGCDERSQDG